jgi:putative sigma-54 modulation protein
MPMNIQITARHAKASSSLQENITEELQKLEKYSDKITSCHVILDTERDEKTIEIVIALLGQTVKAEAKADNIGKAVDSALQKIERQLKKFNEKMKSHKATRVVPVPPEEPEE